MIIQDILGYALLVGSALLLVATIALLVYSRKRWRDLDDQGIRLIQLTNLYDDLKMRVEAVQSNVRSILQSMDETNLRIDSVSLPAAEAEAEAEEEPSEVFEADGDEQEEDDEIDEEDITNPRRKDESEPLELDVERGGATIRMSSEEISHLSQVDSGESAATNVVYRNAPAKDDDADATSIDAASAKKIASRDAVPLDSDEDTNKKRKKKARISQQFRELPDFIDHLADGLSKSGFFYPTKKLLPVGVKVEFQFSLKDGSPLLNGQGEVKRLHKEAAGSKRAATGMEIRFIYLDTASKEMIRRILSQRG